MHVLYLDNAAGEFPFFLVPINDERLEDYRGVMSPPLGRRW